MMIMRLRQSVHIMLSLPSSYSNKVNIYIYIFWRIIRWCCFHNRSSPKKKRVFWQNLECLSSLGKLCHVSFAFSFFNIRGDGDIIFLRVILACRCYFVLSTVIRVYTLSLLFLHVFRCVLALSLKRFISILIIILKAT